MDTPAKTTRKCSKRPDGASIHPGWSLSDKLGSALITGGLLVCALIVSCSSIALAEAGSSQIANGDKQLAAGDVPEAVQTFQQVVKNNPDSAEAHERLGRALSRFGKFSEAEVEERKAIELKKNNPEAHTDLGWIYGRRKKFTEAINELNTALAAAPESENANACLGLVLASSGDYPGAANAFIKAIKIDPSIGSNYLNLAAVYGKLEKYTECAECYKKAIERGESSAIVYTGLGTALGKLGDNAGQVEAYKKAATADAGNAECHGRLAWVYLRDKNWFGWIKESFTANSIRGSNYSGLFLKMVLTAWAVIFIIIGACFSLIYFGPKFALQPGEEIKRTFYLTFYNHRPGRFVITNRRLVFVPELFSTWFGATRLSMELERVISVESKSTVSGGALLINYIDHSVRQFNMPNLVLEPLYAELKAIDFVALAREAADRLARVAAGLSPVPAEADPDEPMHSVFDLILDDGEPENA